MTEFQSKILSAYVKKIRGIMRDDRITKRPLDLNKLQHRILSAAKARPSQGVSIADFTPRWSTQGISGGHCEQEVWMAMSHLMAVGLMEKKWIRFPNKSSITLYYLTEKGKAFNA